MSENNINTIADLLSYDDDFAQLNAIIESIMALSDNELNDDNIDIVEGMIFGALTSHIREDAIASIVRNFHEEGYTKNEVMNIVNTIKIEFNELVNSIETTPLKKRLLNKIFTIFNDIFDEAQSRFGIYDVTVPIKLDKNAIMPKYAHSSDAAADLSSLETVTIPAHSFGNKVKTGVHLQLPNGWQARLAPRSSIGANTPLRLSNSMGIIDTAYTGDITVLFDNISDSDYTITAGDRIAQLWVEPIYRFKGQQVDELNLTERNDAGFGSTGI